MRHPDRQRCRQIAKERRFAFQDFDLRMSVLALGSWNYFATEFVSDEMQSITNTQNGKSKREHALVRRWSIVVVHRAWPPGKNDSRRTTGLNFIKRSRARQDHREDALFPNPARDKLRVLRAKVENDDGLGLHD